MKQLEKFNQKNTDWVKHPEEFLNVARRGRYAFLAPRAGFEPATYRLTAGCSTIELPRIMAH